jgi:hypothetical protein
MPPAPAGQPPATPPAPPGAPPAPPAGDDARLSALETRADRQEGLLQQILDRLPGKTPPGSGGSPPAADPGGGKTIAQLVREGVEELERDRAAKDKAAADDQARKNHADRIARLEERPPREPALTPAGRFRSAVQRVGFGIDEPHR